MSWPSWLPLCETLRPLSPYGAPQLPAEAVLNTNENPYSPSPALQKAITDAVAQVAAKHCPVPIEYIGTQDTFGESGTPNQLLAKYGLDTPDIFAVAKKVLGRKK